MVNVIFRGKIITSLEQEATKGLKQSCLKKQIAYIEDFDNNNLILFPVFEGRTIMIRILTNDQDLMDLAQLLKQKLLLSGAVVIIDQQRNSKKGVLRLSDDQLVLCFNKNPSMAEEVVLYSSFCKTTNYDRFVKNIIKCFAQDSPGASFDVAGVWQKIINFKYWRYLVLTQTPTLLMEFGNAELVTSLREKFSQWLLYSYIQCYGEIHTPDQMLMVDKLLEELAQSNQLEQEKIGAEKQIAEASNNFRKLLENLEHKEAEIKKLLLSQIVPVAPSGQTEENQTQESKEKLQNPTPAPKPTTASTASSRKANPLIKGSSLNKGRKISHNYTQYPLLPLSDGPAYQFIRAAFVNEAFSTPSSQVRKQTGNPNICQTAGITKSMFCVAKERDNVSSSEVQQTRDSGTVGGLEHKTDLQETESLEFATALQNFKRINLAD